MLHFEMYQGSVGGNYTQKKNKEYDFVEPKAYKRRRDLLDPTPYLDEWRMWTDFTNWVGDLFN